MTGDRKDAVALPGDRARIESEDRAKKMRQDAVRWLSLMSSGRATGADADALKQWCREDPAHEAAYAKAALVWDMLTPVARGAREDHAETLEQMARPERAGHGPGRRAFLGAAVAASAGVAGYLVLRPPLGLWPSLAELGADVRTSTGEQRRITVADDIGVDLNTRSSLSVRAASDGGHRIELICGEAIVAAGPEAAGSCTVIAGGGRILARDAKVDVRYDGTDVRVTCITGSVRVERGSQGVTVPAQEQVVYGDRGISGVGTVDPATVTAWQQGLLVFRQKPLSRVVEEVNRYRPGRIILLNQELGRHLIDARFRLGHLENVIIYLQQAFDARITELPGGIVLVS
jgi:transmembrane sensor